MADSQVQPGLPLGVSSLSEFVTLVQARDAASHSTAVGLIILLYDHILLLPDEIELVWSAAPGWPKYLFLVSRYSVPVFILVAAHATSAISTAGLSPAFVPHQILIKDLSCKGWVVCVGLGSATSLFICNVFAVQRVDALWGRSTRIRWMMLPLFGITYIGAAILGLYGMFQGDFKDLIGHHALGYTNILGTCLVTVRLRYGILGYALPIIFDVWIFVLICWNALDRPRHLHTTIIKQLYIDGALYFVVTIALRLFNVVVLKASNPIPNWGSSTLFKDYTRYDLTPMSPYSFLWAIIPAIMNRMVIKVTKKIVDPSGGLPYSLVLRREPAVAPLFQLKHFRKNHRISDIPAFSVHVETERQSR
ncbi:hypothetical protein M422DRAFT_275537 [Sphaerobolus stellatus SS14]|uniref:Unplaced genomic scaffold SPHSTscaffold_507, whole genome shotgun sequence n=1 Tax=Sphaerobolus stellatus (strain SS14) TaxID=990650 RepID=A0A0C9UEB2_SPHS4|nr:hypothetical protein M422DRAFT_275537 [Sphaerobolus stellatus SS14]